MDLEKHIQEIRAAIEAAQFSNEASVSQGIVLRLLTALGWPCYDTQVVIPEYSLEGRRVDFALCHPPEKPKVFIEVKQVGRQSEDSERQLFEYVFHKGVPLAILTNGQEWHFFLPGEEGAYGERKVYKLDLLEREVGECASRLVRYLKYQAIVSGDAIVAAREDYQHVARNRLIEATLPEAWEKLLEDEDDLLIELIADRAASLCGYKPNSDTVTRFLEDNLTLKEASPTQPPGPPKPPRGDELTGSELGDEPEYIETYRKMLINPGSLPSKMRKHIDEVGSITWRDLQRVCVERFGCKSETSGSIGASLQVLRLDGHVRVRGRGNGKKIFSARTSK